jgi:hypothetical protein
MWQFVMSRTQGLGETPSIEKDIDEPGGPEAKRFRDNNNKHLEPSAKAERRFSAETAPSIVPNGVIEGRVRFQTQVCHCVLYHILSVLEPLRLPVGEVLSRCD